MSDEVLGHGRGVVWRRFRDDVLVLGGDERYHHLAGSAALLWRLLDHPGSLADLGDDVHAVLGLDRGDIDTNLRSAAQTLSELGLIEAIGPDAPPTQRNPSPVVASDPEPAALSDVDAVAGERIAAEAEFAAAVAAVGLPGATPIPRLPAGLATDRLAAAVASQRCAGTMLDLVSAGVLDVPDSLVEPIAEAHKGALLWCLLLERRLLQILERFDDVGIRAVLIKGPAIAHLDRGDPARRTFADLDLLVPRRNIDRATALLIAEFGGSRPWAERTPGFDRRFAKSVTVTLPDGIEIDLHRNLCDGVHGARVPVEELVAAPATVVVGGRAIPTLQRGHRLLHAAYHLVLGSPTPDAHNLRDLAGLLADPRVGPDRVGPTVRRWRGEAVLATAIDEVAAGVAAPVPEPWRTWRSSVVIDPAETGIVAEQRRDGSSFGPGRRGLLGELPSRTDQFRYLRAVFWPSAAHLASRGMRRRDLLPQRLRLR